MKFKSNEHRNLRTVHTIVHNCHTVYTTWHKAVLIYLSS